MTTPTPEHGPELPKPAIHAFSDLKETFLREHHYTADQMREYARAAIQQAAEPDLTAAYLLGRAADVEKGAGAVPQLSEDEIIAMARLHSSENHYSGGRCVRMEFTPSNILTFARALAACPTPPVGQLGAGGWQPIETAPRGSGADGPRMVTHPDYVTPPRLLLASDDDVEVGYYDWYYHAGYGRGAEPGVSAWRRVGDEPIYPTHWMPLPPPPAHGINPAPSDPSGYHDPQRIAAWNAANPDAPTHQKEGKP